MILNKLKVISQVVGWVGFILLALQGALTSLDGQPAWAAPLLQWGGSTVPLVVNYQGYLRNAEGTPLSGTYDITFKIYNDVIAGNVLYEETQTGVSVRNGYFSVLLGNNAPENTLPPNLFNTPDRFIGITVAPYAEMIPRQRFATVPYAFQAQNANNANNANLLDGRDSTSFADKPYEYSLRAPDGSPNNAVFVNNDGNVGVSTTGPRDRLEVNGALRLASDANSCAGSPANCFGYLRHAGSGGLVINSHTGGTWADMHLQTNGATRLFIESGGAVGIGTTDPRAKLHVADGEIRGKLQYTEEFRVSSTLPIPQRLIRADEGFCFLTNSSTGALISVGGDGYWYLTGGGSRARCAGRN